MRKNALWVRWAKGWTIVEDAAAIAATGLRIEGTLGLGTIQTGAEAERIARAELARFATGQTELAFGFDPSGDGDNPFDDFNVGDSVEVDGEDRRVIKIPTTQDGDRVVFAPQVGDVIDSRPVRELRISRKMSLGTIGGFSRAATPLSMSSAPMAQRGGAAVAAEGCCADVFHAFREFSVPEGDDSLEFVTPNSFGGFYTPAWDDGIGYFAAGVWSLSLSLFVNLSAVPQSGDIEASLAATRGNVLARIHLDGNGSGGTAVAPATHVVYFEDQWSSTIFVGNFTDQDANGFLQFSGQRLCEPCDLTLPDFG